MLYEIAKYLHIVLTIVWLGGVFTVVFLGTLAARENEQARLTEIARLTETLANRIFLPSTIGILIVGVYMVLVKWSFVEAWVVIGIIGVVLTGAMGRIVLAPLTTKLGELEVGAESAVTAEKLLRNARADLVMLAVIVWAMVSKPAWADWGEILLMLAVVVLGWLLFLRR